MTQFSYQPPTPQPVQQGGSGLAIAALVCGCVGLILPGVGLIGVVLGIIALLKPTTPPGAKGMAIGGLCVGAVSLITMFMCAGIMLPALGKARQTARQLKSGTQVMQVGIALQGYAADNQDWFPESADGLSRLVASGEINPETLISPHADGSSEPSYIYVPPRQSLAKIVNPAVTVVVYENPSLVRGMVNVLFVDGHIEAISPESLNQYLARQGVPPAKPRASGGS